MYSTSGGNQSPFLHIDNLWEMHVGHNLCTDSDSTRFFFKKRLIHKSKEGYDGLNFVSVSSPCLYGMDVLTIAHNFTLSNKVNLRSLVHKLAPCGPSEKFTTWLKFSEGLYIVNFLSSRVKMMFSLEPAAQSNCHAKSSNILLYISSDILLYIFLISMGCQIWLWSWCSKTGNVYLIDRLSKFQEYWSPHNLFKGLIRVKILDWFLWITLHSRLA